MRSSSPLPRALRANALASLVTGMAGVLMSAPLAQTIGLISGPAYQVVGAALLVHCGVLMWATGRARIADWARLNLHLLAVYGIALLALLLLATIATGPGRALLLADALLVGALALWQLRALTQAQAPVPPPAQ